MNQPNKTRQSAGNRLASPAISPKTRGAAMRAQKRNQDDANKVISQYGDASQTAQQHSTTDQTDKLKITFLGGMDDVGEKNMTVIEYGNDALVLDCGSNLSIDLPGINYEINDTSYLDTIRHKLKGYVITHGHLDHIGGLRHTVPQFPAPVYGSRYTIGVVERTFAEEPTGFMPQVNVMDTDSHERLKVGAFFVELIRVTHSIPDPTAICIDTPVGRIIATGDFRLDPEPLDNLQSDTARLRQLGDEGVLVLLSESSYADVEGRTPTEHTLQASFDELIADAPGRILVAVFSSNINRAQMIINAAVAAGRHIALDGRSMLGYVEIAVRQGILKVPKGTILSMQQASTVADNKLLVLCTGGQGEPNAALQRMSVGEHKYIHLKPEDTVVISSTPIPGNEIRYAQSSNRLTNAGVRLFRHPTHQLDGCGPLHVSGHARRDELREMIELVRPKFFVPVHGGSLPRKYHAQLATQTGIPEQSVLLANNGDCLLFTPDSVQHGGTVPHGSLLIDQTGNIVQGIVIKDRLVLSQEGIVSVVLTIDRKSGQLLASPDIISRGFIALRDSEELMRLFRSELRRAVGQRFKRVELDRFKTEIRDFVTHFLFDQVGRSPIVIPVINVIDGQARSKPVAPKQPAPSAVPDEQRFQEMRARLLG